MNGNLSQAQAAIRRCIALRSQGANEATLRAELHSRLRSIFPDAADESWINHYGEGSEAHTKLGRPDGKAVSRFIDNLVGYTPIEYKADLRVSERHDEGLAQLRFDVGTLGLIDQDHTVLVE